MRSAALREAVNFKNSAAKVGSTPLEGSGTKG